MNTLKLFLLFSIVLSTAGNTHAAYWYYLNSDGICSEPFWAPPEFEPGPNTFPNPGCYSATDDSSTTSNPTVNNEFIVNINNVQALEVENKDGTSMVVEGPEAQEVLRIVNEQRRSRAPASRTQSAQPTKRRK